MFSTNKKSFPDPEIPVWVDGRKKWVTGISRRTTFDDIVFALLKHQLSIANGLRDTDIISEQQIHDKLYQYQIVEVRDDVERLIKGRVKVMKVWRSWSSSKARITLFLRKITEVPKTEHGSFFQRLLWRNKQTPDKISPFNDERSSIDTLLTKDRLLNHQINRIEDLNKNIDHFEKQLSNSPIQEMDEDEQFVMSLFPSITKDTLSQFNNLSNAYYHLTDSLTRFNKTSNDLENVLNTEMKSLPSISSLNSPIQLIKSDESIRQSIYASREVTRMQCKEIHDIELRMRDLDKSLEAKKTDLNRLETMLLSRMMEQSGGESEEDESSGERQLKVLERQSPSVWVKLACSPKIDRKTHKLCAVGQDNDSGINSMTSDENNIYHQVLKSSSNLQQRQVVDGALETLV